MTLIVDSCRNYSLNYSLNYTQLNAKLRLRTKT